MNWIEGLSEAIRYIEENLAGDIDIDDVAKRAYSSSSHFQFIFHVVTGITIGEYIRNRRLSLAARELLSPGKRMADVAERFGYDTPESFSKAFARFHGVPPSKIQKENARWFHPLTIEVTIRGGFDMARGFTDEFHLLDWTDIQGQALSGEEKYRRITTWAREARGQNPRVFDALTGWILDDEQWDGETLSENEQILLGGVFARFRDQNARLRACLGALKPEGIVNEAVFGALNRFDEALSGVVRDEALQAAISRMFSDFSCMRDRGIREKIAGNQTGPSGTDNVDKLGYVNCLKDLDAQVQWTLFMPDVTKAQQKGFRVERFEYQKLPAMRFIGREGEDLASPEARKALFSVLDDMRAYNTQLDFDVLFMHHYGLGVDVGPWHGVWGRFMQANAPVPEGFIAFDFAPEDDGKAGPPYISQFAIATFSGDQEAMHRREGYDSDAMYDVTRNIILGQGVNIPYPNKYWTAEAFQKGNVSGSTVFMFSVFL